MRIGLLLLALTTCAFWPQFGFPEWRGTEARRVEIAHEMLQSGDYIVPRIWGDVTLTKPPLYYWVLAGMNGLFGRVDWAMRLPSLLGWWLLAWIGFLCLKRWFDEPSAWLGAVGVIVAPVICYDGPFAEIDPFFAVLCALSVLALVEGVYAKNTRSILLAGLLGGLAVMTKGPPYLMFCLGPFVLWFRQVGGRRFLHGFVPYLLLVLAPYGIYYLVLQQQLPPEIAEADTGNTAVSETAGRLAFWEPKALKGIPGHLLNCMLAIGLPFSFWWVSWFRQRPSALDAASQRRDMLLYGALGSFVVLCFSTGRSTRYLLPAIPLAIFGLAPLVAVWLRRSPSPEPWVRKCLAGFGVLCALGALAMPWLPHPYPGTTGIALLALACVPLDSGRGLVRYALLMPLLVAWLGFPDRIRYFEHAEDFAPRPAAILARELRARGIEAIQTDYFVGTSMLLHTQERHPELQIRGSENKRRAITSRHVVVQDRGYLKYPERTGDARLREYRDLPGYRDVLRVQLADNKSVSLRVRR